MDREQYIEVLKSGKLTDKLTLVFDYKTAGFVLIDKSVDTEKRLTTINREVAKAYVNDYTSMIVKDTDLQYLPKFKTDYKPKKPFGAFKKGDLKYFNVHHEPEIPDGIEGRIHHDFGKLFLNLFEDKKGVEYALYWLANMVQGNKNETALLLYGIEGAGKGTLYKIAESMIGSTNVLIAGNSTLESQFNQELADIRFLGFNETNSYDKNHTVLNKLKTMITDPTMLINGKQRIPYVINNLANIVLATNSHNAVKVTPTDRRFNVFKQSNKLIDVDSDLSKRLHKLIESDEVFRLKQFLINLDLSEWESRKPFENGTRQRMMMTTATKKEWLIHLIKDDKGRATKELYFNDVLNIGDSDNLDFNALSEDDHFNKVIAKTEYAKHSSKVADTMIIRDYELLYSRGILASRYGILLYRVATDDLKATPNLIGRFYSGFFESGRFVTSGKVRIRGYKVR